MLFCFCVWFGFAPVFGTCRTAVQTLELHQHIVGKHMEGGQVLRVKGTKPEEDNLQMDSGQAGLSSLSLPVGRLPSLESFWDSCQ